MSPRAAAAVVRAVATRCGTAVAAAVQVGLAPRPHVFLTALLLVLSPLRVLCRSCWRGCCWLHKNALNARATALVARHRALLLTRGDNAEGGPELQASYLAWSASNTHRMMTEPGDVRSSAGGHIRKRQRTEQHVLLRDGEVFLPKCIAIKSQGHRHAPLSCCADGSHRTACCLL